MTERDDSSTEFSDEELEALAGDALPDRAATSTMNSELAGLGVDDVSGAPPEDQP